MLICSNTKVLIFITWLMTSLSVYAQTDWSRLLLGTIKAGQAVMITDEELLEIVEKEVTKMDRQHIVSDNTSKYDKRIRRLTKGMTDADGITLNFNVYETDEINAFACPDGSVRVFSALMDILNDQVVNFDLPVNSYADTLNRVPEERE